MLNLEIIKVIEDTDPTTRLPRVRVEVRELALRRHIINLKNLDASQLKVFYDNQNGGVLSLPAREMLFNGRFMLSLENTDDEIFVLREAPKVDKTTGEIKPLDNKLKV